MITNISVENLQDGFFRVLGELKTNGKTVDIGYKNAGGVITKELHPCMIEIKDPTKRTILYPKRGNNPFATLAETYWVLAGRNDVAWLSKFLPRAVDFSDDGTVWRAGYGPRLRKWKRSDMHSDVASVDQLQFIIRQLTKNPASRQAIMSIWDPAIECTVESTKDWPCSNWVHFMIRDNKLNCTVVMRSNDIIWGWSSINVYEFTVIQEIIAKALGVDVGTYNHLSDSMHIYQKDFEKMDTMIESYVDIKSLDLPKFRFMNDLETVQDNAKDYLENYLYHVEQMCNNIEWGKYSCETPYADLNTASLLLTEYKGDWISNEAFKRVPFSDLKVACHYWMRKNILKEKDGGLPMILDSIEICKSM